MRDMHIAHHDAFYGLGGCWILLCRQGVKHGPEITNLSTGKQSQKLMVVAAIRPVNMGFFYYFGAALGMGVAIQRTRHFVWAGLDL